MLGREVATLVNEVRQPGAHTVKFEAGNLASGIYLYRLRAGDYTATKRFVILK
jgi:hypothetical protein